MIKEKIKKILYGLLRLLSFGVFIFYAIFSLLTYFDYLEKYLYPLHFLQGEVLELNENIFVGPYPHFDELKRLQKETGIEVVISLLNVGLPQEKALLKREEKIVERLGISLYSYPLSYFNFNNEYNKKTINELIAFIRDLGDKKIYIHCYLGRHRVKQVRMGLKEAGLLDKISVKANR